MNFQFHLRTQSILSIVLCVFIAASTGGPCCAQEATAKAPTDSPVLAEATPALALVKNAMDAQDAGAFQTAAEHWQQLLSDDENSPIAAKAHLNAGLCFTRLQKFEQSIFHFKAGLRLISPESVGEIPQALLYLGYSQLELGRSLLDESVEAVGKESLAQQQKNANEELTTATQTLGRLLRRFPDFEGTDQAAFFQGEAYAALGRLEEAAESYESMLKLERPLFAADGRFALANINEKLGRYDAALVQYDRLLNETPTSPEANETTSEAHQSLRTETAFRSAELLMRLADADREQDQAELAAKQYASAFDRYQRVIKNATDGENSDRLIPPAIYGAAWSKLQMAGDDSAEPLATAEALFTRLINDYPDHPLVADAKTGRGSARRLAGELTASVADLEAAASADSQPAGDENTQLELGLAHVQLKEFDRAIRVLEQLVTQFPKSTQADRYRYELAWALKSLAKPKDEQVLEQFSEILEEFPTSKFAPEAHFHLATEAYESEDYPAAASHYAEVVDSDLPAMVRERSRFQLAWTEYRLGNFESAAQQFAQQTQDFPSGQLSADGKFMFAESQFRLNKHADALQAYLVAKPAVDANGNVDPKIRLLTMLHGAKSANESKKFVEAIDLATPITLADVDRAYQQEAWLEIGIARAGLGDTKSAMDAWNQALSNLGLTGVRARCLLGDALSQQGDSLHALNQFKLVYYGFGGIKSQPKIKPWQAYALYESARLNQKLCRDADTSLQRKLINNAIEQYEMLLTHYSDNALAAEAKTQLEKLKQF